MDCLSSAPPYSSFLSKYLIPSRPCLIDIDLTAEWPAHPRWTRSARGHRARPSAAPTREPNWDYLEEQHGELVVPVVVTLDEDEAESCRTEKYFAEVLQKWREQALIETDEKGKSAAPKERWYVKDWHLAAQLEARQKEQVRVEGKPSAPTRFYTTPEIFQDDWLNAFYLAQRGDDFRFVYMGEQGTITPLHRDVYASNSWSTNVLGTKLWTLFPPSVARCLRKYASESSAADLIPDIRRLGNNPYPDPKLAKEFPRWREAWEARIEVVQQDGETIFVPTGWHHQVENLSPFVISINHNWANSTTFPSLYAAHCDVIAAAEAAMGDVKELLQSQKKSADAPDEWQKEWIECVTNVVRADAGWDWETLWACALHALSVYSSATLEKPNPPTFPPAPAALRPSASFAAKQLQPCIESFTRRPEYLFSGPDSRLHTTVEQIREWVAQHDVDDGQAR